MTAVVLAEGLRFPEGPLFDHDGQLWCVELLGEAITRIGSEGALERFQVGGRPNGLALGKDGLIWYCDAGLNQVRRLDPATGETACVADSVDGHGLAGPNDLAFDTHGNLVFTCPGNSRQEATGYVCCLDMQDKVRIIADGLLFPNGLAFSADGATLYVAETYAQRISAGRWDGRNWIDPQPLFSTPGPNGPDGLALSANGDIYAAVYGQGIIMVATSEGTIRTPLVVDGRNPSNCAFDPTGRLGLLVTEADTGRVLSYKDAGQGARPFFGPAAKACA